MNDTISIAQYDLRNARRSRILWGVVGIYVAFVALLFYASSTGPSPTVENTIIGAVFFTAVLLPLVAIAGSYLAVAGERESNTIRFLLSQPVDRPSVVAGKLLSRGAMTVGALVLALAVGVVITLLTFPDPDLGPILPFGAFTVLLVGAYVSVAVAISAVSTSRSRAIAGTIGVYFVTDLLSVVQGVGLEALLRGVLGDLLGVDLTDTFYNVALAVISPTRAYINATLGTIDQSQLMGDASAEVPVFLEPPAMAAVLGAWIVVPLVLGVVAFSRAEIA